MSNVQVKCPISKGRERKKREDRFARKTGHFVASEDRCARKRKRKKKSESQRIEVSTKIRQCNGIMDRTTTEPGLGVVFDEWRVFSLKSLLYPGLFSISSGAAQPQTRPVVGAACGGDHEHKGL